MIYIKINPKREWKLRKVEKSMLLAVSLLRSIMEKRNSSKIWKTITAELPELLQVASWIDGHQEKLTGRLGFPTTTNKINCCLECKTTWQNDAEEHRVDCPEIAAYVRFSGAHEQQDR